MVKLACSLQNDVVICVSLGQAMLVRHFTLAQVDDLTASRSGQKWRGPKVSFCCVGERARWCPTAQSDIPQESRPPPLPQSRARWKPEPPAWGIQKQTRPWLRRCGCIPVSMCTRAKQDFSWDWTDDSNTTPELHNRIIPEHC